MIEKKFDVTGMTCAACQSHVSKSVEKLEGVNTVDVSLLSNSMKVTFDEDQLDENSICLAVEKAGYGAIVQGTKEHESSFSKEWKQRKEAMAQEQSKNRKRWIYSVILLGPLMVVAMGHMLPIAIFHQVENAMIFGIIQLLLSTIILGIQKEFFVRGFKALIHNASNMDTLVAVGSSAAYIYGLISLLKMAYGFGYGQMDLVYEGWHSLYFEAAAMIVTLVSVGKYLESRSKAKTGDALDKLMDLAPKMAVVLREGKEVYIPTEEIIVGDILMVRPGQKIAVDGIVTQGIGYVDQSSITGESMPVEKKEGDSVLSATVNENGSFQMRAIKVGDDTTLSQIIRLVDEAGNTKAPIARVADKVSGVFVPVVMSLSLLTALVWLMLGYPLDFALSNAIAVLVVSCPCALGLATPVAIMVATGKAASQGILIKNAESLETLHTIDTIILDKTGTITTGKPTVQDVEIFNDWTQEQFLQMAASLEYKSLHPLAQAVVNYTNTKKIELLETKDFYSDLGKGVRALLQENTYYAGNIPYMIENGLAISKSIQERYQSWSKQGKTPLLFANTQEIIGCITVSDTIRETSKQAIRSFQERGIHVVMLTGDNQNSAQAIAGSIGIDEVISDVLPADKERVVRQYQEKGHTVMMVGDGINDAPSLTRANIGVSVQSGTDIAMDSSDVVLMKNTLMDVVYALDLSKATIRNIHMNLFWAFFYNILGIPVAAGLFYTTLGWSLSPMLGSAMMSLSSICVVTNALRLRFFKTVNIEKKEEEKKMKKQIQIEGMMCQHCVKHVDQALRQLPEIENVEVSLEKNHAIVTLKDPIDDQKLIDVITEEGYTVTNIQ